MAEYVPIRPVGGNVFANGPDPVTHEAAGFFQPAGPEEVSRRRAAVRPFIEGIAEPATLDLQTYQEWAELDWKAPHGSYEAVERLMGKIVEEAGIEFVHAHRHRDSLDSNQVLDEVGDALWCTVAVASNAGVNLTEAARRYLRTWYLHPEPYGPITFGELTQKLRNRKPSHVIDPHALPETYDPDDYVPDITMYLSWFSVTVGNVLARQYGYNEKPDYVALARYMKELTSVRTPQAEDVLQEWAKILLEFQEASDNSAIESYILEGYFKKIGEDLIRPMIGDGIVFLEHVARVHDSDLGTIAVMNARKITGRVAANKIDKTDGER